MAESADKVECSMEVPLGVGVVAREPSHQVTVDEVAAKEGYCHELRPVLV